MVVKLVYRWQEKVKLVVTTLSLRAGRCAADGARGKAGSFPTSHEDGDMSNTRIIRNPWLLMVNNWVMVNPWLFHRDYCLKI